MHPAPTFAERYDAAHNTLVALLHSLPSEQDRYIAETALNRARLYTLHLAKKEA